jgi:hypothetical protein
MPADSLFTLIYVRSSGNPFQSRNRVAARPQVAGKRFRLSARVSSDSPKTIGPVLEAAVAKGSVKEVKGEFVVEAEMEGESAKELNRALLSALRKAEKRTRLRSEWSSEDGTTQRFFDYVLKKTTRAGPQA